jgi:long-chain fatty acid transport protein
VKRSCLPILTLALLAGPAHAQLGPAFAGRMAQADNAAVVNSNPAGITRVRGTQLVVDTSLAQGFSRFRVGPGTTESGGSPNDDDVPTVIPTLSLSHELSERWRLGFGLFVPAGIGTDYGTSWAGRYYTTESSLVFLSAQPVVAVAVTDWLSLSAGASIMYVDSVSESAINNVLDGRPDGRVRLELDGVSAGAVVSALVEPWPGTRFGVSYRNEQNPDLEGKPRFRNLGLLLENGLNLAGVLGSDIDIGINVPQTLQAGFFHQLDDRLSIMGDLTWMDWSRFGRVNVSVSRTSITSKQDYNDIWFGSLGAQYRIRDDLSASAGFSYLSSAVDSEDRTLALPFDEVFLFGLGGAVRARENLAIHGNLSMAISGNGRIDQRGNPLAGRVRGKSEDTYTLLFQVSLVWGTRM